MPAGLVLCARYRGKIMTDQIMLGMLTQLLLPMFIVALLFSLVGVDPAIVVKAAASIAVAVLSGLFSVLKTLLGFIFGIKRSGTIPRGKKLP
jgi:hypothetical protein